MKILNLENQMKYALEEAVTAFNKGEVPVGAIVVYKGRIISRAHNLVESSKDRAAHAEMLALGQALSCFPERKRLDGCTLYSTLEPCAMCAGAIVNYGVSRVVFGAYDPQFGCAGSLTDIPRILANGNINVIGGVLESECKTLLDRFFKCRRESD